MLGYLSGNVIALGASYVIINVHGVGYRVHVGASILAESQESKPLSLFIYHHIREDINQLFGFKTHDELVFYEKLLTVQGVGPKGALSMMNLASVTKLMTAIVTKDQALLSSVPGIGKKTAAKIIIELANKLGSDLPIGLAESGGGVTEDVIAALESLGYPMKNIRAILGELDATRSAEEQVKQALVLLGRKMG